jgi:hypothetical protein
MSDQHPIPGPGFWYLAGPYSDDPDTRYHQHMEATALLANSGLNIFSTIIHNHPMARKYAMPTDADFWKGYNFSLIDKSNGIILYQLPTWKESRGVRDEILHCQMRALPVWGLQPIIWDKAVEWVRLH